MEDKYALVVDILDSETLKLVCRFSMVIPTTILAQLMAAEWGKQVGETMKEMFDESGKNDTAISTRLFKIENENVDVSNLAYFDLGIEP